MTPLGFLFFPVPPFREQAVISCNPLHHWMMMVLCPPFLFSSPPAADLLMMGWKMEAIKYPFHLEIEMARSIQFHASFISSILNSKM